MPTFNVDDIKFVTIKPKLASNGLLAKQLEKEFKVKVVFLKKLSTKDYSIAFVLQGSENKVYVRYDLSEAQFNYAVFHEIRHILQERSKSFMLYYRPKRGSDVVRYLFDCISCEIDADIFSIRECAARQLPSCLPGYLKYSKKAWGKFVMRYAKESVVDYKVTQKQVDAIVSLLADPMRLRK